MPKIILSTKINSSIEVCFDLSRSIDLHKITTVNTKEEAINGTTSGLINLNETVTWQAIHFGVKQKLTSKITSYDRPFYFVDEQLQGVFKSIYHLHKFEVDSEFVTMTDEFEFQSPFGIIGKVFNKIILEKYLIKLLTTRNNIIKEFAETDKWKSVLNENEY